MGTVYKAIQCEPVRRTVALKMIRRGMADESTLRRFHAERQALALMDHPDISQIFEADTTPDGNPYFAMEYCTGEPIDRYCKSHNLDLLARLSLVIRIARAVQQAHSRGVIHRDLKPGNVLVSHCEGGLSLKIIDFGIAKFTDDQWHSNDHEETRVGELVGTPAYMSPEQASGINIDARTDVFAIGAILFKLLTDTIPLLPKTDGDDSTPSLSSIIEQLQSYTPVTPSSRLATLNFENRQVLAEQFCFDSPKKLIHMIRGDLDWITLRAIEWDRTRRYATANDLADDLQRSLQHDPVTAIAPSKLYRAKKYYERHRVPVLASGAIFVVILVSSIIGGIGWWNYEQERAEEIKRVAEEAEILLNDAEASRRLAAKGGPDTDENFIAAETSIATAESLLSGPHGLPHLSSRLNASRRATADDRSAMRLVQQLEDARERASQIASNNDDTTFGRQAGFNDISAAFEQFGLRIAITPPDKAAEKLLKCPKAVQPHLIEALDFLILDCAVGLKDSMEDKNHKSSIADVVFHRPIQGEKQQQRIQSQFDGKLAHWANDVLSMIDQDVWRSQLCHSILTTDRSRLRLLSKSPELVDQPVSSVIQLAQVRQRLERSTNSIDLLRSVQRRDPANFWANHSLALALSAADNPKLSEQTLRYLTATVSLRPHSVGASRWTWPIGAAWLTDRQLSRLSRDEYEHSAGFVDLHIGTKSLLHDTPMLQVAMQMTTTVPTANSRSGLGTGHVSLEPALLIALALTDRDSMQSQVAQSIPLGGDPDYQGALLRWGVAWNRIIWQRDHDNVATLNLDLVGWSFQDGAYTDPVLGRQRANDETYVYLGPGARWLMCGKFEFGVGGIFALSDRHFAQHIMRTDFTIRY